MNGKKSLSNDGMLVMSTKYVIAGSVSAMYEGEQQFPAPLPRGVSGGPGRAPAVPALRGAVLTGRGGTRDARNRQGRRAQGG